MNRIANLLTGLSLAVLFFSASAYAQNDGQKLIADVPFEFTVGRVALPPGHYAFVHTSSYIFQVIAANGHSWLTDDFRCDPGESAPRKIQAHIRYRRWPSCPGPDLEWTRI